MSTQSQSPAMHNTLPVRVLCTLLSSYKISRPPKCSIQFADLMGVKKNLKESPYLYLHFNGTEVASNVMQIWVHQNLGQKNLKTGKRRCLMASNIFTSPDMQAEPCDSMQSNNQLFIFISNAQRNVHADGMLHDNSNKHTHTHKQSEASFLLCYNPTWSLNFTAINGYNDIRTQNGRQQ